MSHTNAVQKIMNCHFVFYLCGMIVVVLFYCYRDSTIQHWNENEISYTNVIKNPSLSKNKTSSKKRSSLSTLSPVVAKDVKVVSSVIPNMKTSILADLFHNIIPSQVPKVAVANSHILSEFGFYSINQYDYENITYPIPFSRLYNDYTSHYLNYGKPDRRFPSFIGLGDVDKSAFDYTDIVVVTGSSQNHMLANINLMYSVVYTNSNISMVFVDFGLTDDGMATLISEFTKLHKIHTILGSTAKLYYRKFNFGSFPAWFDITDPEIRGGYSWKVISYFDVLNQTKKIVNWSDGGNLWSHSIMKDTIRVKQEGLYTPYSGDSIISWAHPKSRNFLESHNMVRHIYSGKGMCTGGYIFVNYKNSTIMDNIIYPLLQCAYTRRCITPEKTSRKNHRQDQAVLSVLVHSLKIASSCNSRYGTMTSFHKDCHEPERCSSLQSKIVKNIAHRYNVNIAL